MLLENNKKLFDGHIFFCDKLTYAPYQYIQLSHQYRLIKAYADTQILVGPLHRTSVLGQHRYDEALDSETDTRDRAVQ